MKNIFLALFLALGYGGTSQTYEKNLGDFSTLKVFDLIEVKLIQSSQNKAVVSGENKDNIRFINKNGKLKIRMNIEESYDGANTYVTLYYTNLKVVDANEGAYIYFDKKVKQSKIELKTQEGGKIKALLNTGFTKIKAVTGGVIEVSGKTKNLDVNINTGGIYNGEDFASNIAEVSVNAAGEAHVNAKEDIDIKIRAGGDVYIYGNPKHINKNRVFGGRIKEM